MTARNTSRAIARISPPVATSSREIRQLGDATRGPFARVRESEPNLHERFAPDFRPALARTHWNDFCGTTFWESWRCQKGHGTSKQAKICGKRILTRLFSFFVGAAFFLFLVPFALFLTFGSFALARLFLALRTQRLLEDSYLLFTPEVVSYFGMEAPGFLGCFRQTKKESIINPEPQWIRFFLFFQEKNQPGKPQSISPPNWLKIDKD